MKKVEAKYLVEGLLVVDSDGNKGKIIDCKDLHNVHVIFEGSGLLVEINGKEIDCGGSGLYCFAECDENCEDIDPLFFRI